MKNKSEEKSLKKNLLSEKEMIKYVVPVEINLRKLQSFNRYFCLKDLKDFMQTFNSRFGASFLRNVIESIAHDLYFGLIDEKIKKKQDKSLQYYIQELNSKDILDNNKFDLLEILKILGNKASHPSGQKLITKEFLIHGYEVLNKIIDWYISVIKENNLKKRVIDYLKKENVDESCFYTSDYAIEYQTKKKTRIFVWVVFIIAILAIAIGYYFIGNINIFDKEKHGKSLSSEEKAKKYVIIADSLFNIKEYKKAYEIYKQAYKLDSLSMVIEKKLKNTENVLKYLILLKKAKRMIDTQDYEKADIYLRKALILEPDSTKVKEVLKIVDSLYILNQIP